MKGKLNGKAPFPLVMRGNLWWALSLKGQFEVVDNLVYDFIIFYKFEIIRICPPHFGHIRGSISYLGELYRVNLLLKQVLQRIIVLLNNQSL